jgi:hypothetical protein
MIQQKYCSKGHLFDGSYKDTNPFYQEINNTTQNEFFGAKRALQGAPKGQLRLSLWQYVRFL